MKKLFSLTSFFLFSLVQGLHAQPYFPPPGHVYNDSILPRIDIFMNPDSFAVMYNDLYTNTEYTAMFIFNDGITADTVQNIGIRIRGNTSQVSQKKSFKISFNTFVPGRKFYDLEKLHLNGEHNDPCITRSKLYWETLESMHIPGPRANHVDLYINNIYYGLYVNVEHIDEQFLASRFGNSYGNLYKCLWPANLAYISNNADDYKLMSGDRRVYDLQTNTGADDYSDLADFISMLQFTSDADFPAELEKLFNVNSFLRDYAVDVATGNWDDYSYNMNNYYLYHNPATGKWEYITYDADNTFGIDWFGVDWGTKSIYNWYNPAVNPILTERVMAVPEYVSRFNFFMKQLQQGMFDTTIVYPVIDSILLKIEASAQADVYRTLDYGWTYNDFLDSYTQALNFQVKYGLKPYFSTRHDQTQIQLQTTDVVPIISDVNHLPSTVFSTDSVFVTARVEDEFTPATVFLNYKVNSGALYTTAMFDDGFHHDEIAGDKIYGAAIPPANVFDTIFYFITATDITAQTGREPGVDYNSIVISPVPHLFINEIMSLNTTAIADEFGEYDDWLEIYNADSFSVFLGDKYLSDEPTNPGKWRMPAVNIPAHGFVLIWCDGQSFQGDFHTSFRLNGSGEQVMLHVGTGLQFILLDSVSFTAQIPDISIGYLPDGLPPAIPFQTPTPGYSNLNVGINPDTNEALLIKSYPNPFHDFLQIEISVKRDVSFSVEIMNLFGGKIYVAERNELLPGKYIFSFPEDAVMRLSNGIYLLKISGMNDHTPFTFTQKLLKN